MCAINGRTLRPKFAFHQCVPGVAQKSREMGRRSASVGLAEKDKLAAQRQVDHSPRGASSSCHADRSMKTTSPKWVGPKDQDETRGPRWSTLSSPVRVSCLANALKRDETRPPASAPSLHIRRASGSQNRNIRRCLNQRDGRPPCKYPPSDMKTGLPQARLGSKFGAAAHDVGRPIRINSHLASRQLRKLTVVFVSNHG